jgi:hypothetical protein
MVENAEFHPRFPFLMSLRAQRSNLAAADTYYEIASSLRFSQ